MVREAGKVTQMFGIHGYFFIPGPGQVTVDLDRVFSLIDRGILVADPETKSHVSEDFILDEDALSAGRLSY